MSLRNLAARACVAAAVLGMVGTSRAWAQEGIAKPTAEHKVLAGDEGTWDAEIKTFMGGPDAPPAVSKGSEVNAMMSGGLWMVSKFEGDFGGMKFEGRGQYGYDPAKKKYVGTWIDSMTPAILALEGTYDPATKTITFEGDGVDPSGKAKFHQKMATVTKDDGTRVFTLSMTTPATGDKEVKFMEITYTKRK